MINLNNLVETVKSILDSNDEETIDFIIGATRDKLLWMNQDPPESYCCCGEDCCHGKEEKKP
jgi:hypothetical protein